MNNTLLIHIGMPKTGTTALQSFLLKNNSKLQKYGWCYPNLDGSDKMEALEKKYNWREILGNGNAYAIYGWLNNGLKSEWDRGMDVALEYLKNKNVIISSENIYLSETDKFIKAVKEKWANIKVVVYLRRQDRAIESFYNQLVKNGTEYNTFENFLESNTVPEDYLAYTSKLDLISQIVGKENLIIRIYEKQQLVGEDTIADFLSILGIAFNKEEWERVKTINLSLAGNYFEINRLINSIQAVDGFCNEKDVRDKVYDVCTELSRSFNEGRPAYGFFTSDERKKFMARFASDNEQVARRYMQREDGVLFYDSRMDYPIFETNKTNDFAADIIRVFSAMMYIYNQSLKDMYKKKNDEYEEKLGMYEKKNNELAGKLLMVDALHKSNNRKILFFGAGYNCQRLFDIVGNIPEALIVDNDLTKKDLVLNGIQVKYAKDIVEWKEYFVIVTCWKAYEIEEQLRSYGLEKEKDYILMKEYIQ